MDFGWQEIYFSFIQHSFFTIKDKKVAAGLYTSILFLAIAVIGIFKLYQTGLVTPISIIISILVALVSFILPAFLQKYVGNILWRNFS
jgi:hypothetical protein